MRLLLLLILIVGPAALQAPLLKGEGFQVEQAEFGVDEMLMADAEAASVVNYWADFHIEDNYGDPSRFQKYYIRRPPVIA